MKKFGLVWALAFVVLASPVFAVGFIIVDEAHWWPGPTPPHPIPPYPPPHPVPPWPPEIIVPRPRMHVFAPLQVQEVKARTHIKDQVASTTVLQEFYNPNSSQLEGTFMFPVPKGAHVDKFSMDIDREAGCSGTAHGEQSAKYLRGDRAQGEGPGIDGICRTGHVQGAHLPH